MAYIIAGYIVVSGLKAANGVQGFRVLVQSAKVSGFVERRIEQFLSRANVRSFGKCFVTSAL